MLQRSYSPITLLSYQKAWKDFLLFLKKHHIKDSLPIPPKVIALYVTYQHTKKLRVSTIRSKLTAIGWVHKINNILDPTKDFLVQRLLMGIKKEQNKPEKLVAPLNFPLLTEVIAVLPGTVQDVYKSVMLKAAFMLAYHGALRIGELAKSNHTNHTLRIENVRLINKISGTSSL